MGDHITKTIKYTQPNFLDDSKTYFEHSKSPKQLKHTPKIQKVQMVVILQNLRKYPSFFLSK